MTYLRVHDVMWSLVVSLDRFVCFECFSRFFDPSFEDDRQICNKGESWFRVIDSEVDRDDRVNITAERVMILQLGS